MEKVINQLLFMRDELENFCNQYENIRFADDDAKAKYIADRLNLTQRQLDKAYELM